MSGRQKVRLPTILIPYPGPLLEPGIQDIFLYLRPESNGVLVESMLFRVIKGNSIYCKKCHIVYLANIPGDFILKKKIVEQHYAVKIRFARLGKRAFTPQMREKFSNLFQIPFKQAPIIGAFAALRRFKMHNEDLFKIWVPPENFKVIYGQSIKLFRGYFIVNYDIPALLHKNSRKTDIAVMICRSGLSKEEYHTLVQEMGERLIEEKVIARDRPLTQTFHYSRGPFEQVLDGIGYLYDSRGTHLPLSSLSFMRYLLQNGCTQEQVLDVLRNPIRYFRTPNGIIEDNIFSISDDATYKEALQLFRNCII
jgi:hypothetical protein